MAEHVPDAQEPPAKTGWAAHDWYSYDLYVTHFQGFLDDLVAEGTVIQNKSLTITPITTDGRLVRVEIRGRLECAHNVDIFVNKTLEVRQTRRRGPEVKGIDYNYQAWNRLTERRLLRYDTAHGMNEIHKHEFDLWAEQKDNEGVRTIIPITDLPLLSDYIRAAVDLGRQLEEEGTAK